MRNLPLGVKLQAGFMLVMLFFTATFIGVSAENAKLKSLGLLLTQALIPGRVCINKLLLDGWTADDEGAYVLMSTSATDTARYLTAYHRDFADFKATLEWCDVLATTPIQRLSIAQIRALVNGPRGWYASNDRAFALKALGDVRLAQNAYIASDPPFVTAANAYRHDVVTRIAASYTESERLQNFSETFGICLGVFALAGGFAISTLLARIVR